jgi:hypothetical protein
MGTELSVDRHWVVLRLVQDVDLVLVTKPHLLVSLILTEAQGNIPSEQRYLHHQQTGKRVAQYR